MTHSEAPQPDSTSGDDIARRRDEVVKRMLAMPPQPKKAKGAAQTLK